ncbi:hypothetical protein B0E53_00311 [Micromonospora sp. MH33]|nr:hypothetical protein B0E53_00311 [Micromonospora sp. MH33]
MTNAALRLGWRPPVTPGRFDLLPWAIETATEDPTLVHVSRELVRATSWDHWPRGSGWTPEESTLWREHAALVTNQAVLHDLARTAAGNVGRTTEHGRRWDPPGPQRSMVNGGDRDMPLGGIYVGVGVTILDSDEGSWHAVAHSVRNQPLDTPRPKRVFNLSGQGLVLLTDGTALRMVRTDALAMTASPATAASTFAAGGRTTRTPTSPSRAIRRCARRGRGSACCTASSPGTCSPGGRHERTGGIQRSGRPRCRFARRQGRNGPSRRSTSEVS